MADDIQRKQYRVEQNKKLRLKDWNPSDTTGMPGEMNLVLDQTAREIMRIEGLQGRLHAEHKHKRRMVLKSSDTAGKVGRV